MYRLAAMRVGQKDDWEGHKCEEQRVEAGVRVHAVPIHKPFHRTREIDVHIKLGFVLGSSNTSQVTEEIFMDFGGEGFGSGHLVADGSVECERLGHNFQYLSTNSDATRNEASALENENKAYVRLDSLINWE